MAGVFTSILQNDERSLIDLGKAKCSDIEIDNERITAYIDHDTIIKSYIHPYILVSRCV